MKAILCFRDYLNKDLISGITQGSNEGSHQNLNGANDFNGRNAQDQVDLLAPYDCKVMAIARYDNAVLFQSLTDVETPIGTYPCWFLCVHMNDNDFNKLGISIGKVFKQGEPCYTEGNKGIGSGYHIHMEQGTGVFSGGSNPYYKSNDVYYLNGKYYYTYYPCIKNGYEYPVYDMFYLKNTEIVLSQTEKNQGHKYYDGKWKVLGSNQIPQTSVSDKNIVEMQNKINDLQKQVDLYKSKLDEIRKVVG